METKQQVTKRLVAGVVIIIFSFVLGKISLIPLFFPGAAWKISAVSIYTASWLLLVTGLLLAGVEGFRLATHKYKEYHHKTVHQVKQHSRNAVRHTANIIKHPITRSKRLVRRATRKGE
ncbi:MAG: hypothetical protein V1729_03855 [Candidatus Woesearchaeota archaeon]